MKTAVILLLTLTIVLGENKYFTVSRDFYISRVKFEHGKAYV